MQKGIGSSLLHISSRNLFFTVEYFSIFITSRYLKRPILCMRHTLWVVCKLLSWLIMGYMKNRKTYICQIAPLWAVRCQTRMWKGKSYQGKWLHWSEKNTSKVLLPEISTIPPLRVAKTAYISFGSVVKAKYDEISTIHIYSLEPSSIEVIIIYLKDSVSEHANLELQQDLQVLSDVKREIISKYVKEDPLVFVKTYGTISNPHVKVQSCLQ